MARPAAPDRRERQQERRARRSAVTDLDTVMAAGAALLATRSRTTRELRDRLVALGYARDLVDRTVDRLSALGYLDDAGYARAWIAGRDRSRPRGAAALRGELLRKGLARDLVDAALAERDASARAGTTGASGHEPGNGIRGATAGDGDLYPSANGGESADLGGGSADLAAASRLLERRRAALQRGADPRKARERAYALLARNGFDPGVCSEAARAFVRDPEEDWQEQV